MTLLRDMLIRFVINNPLTPDALGIGYAALANQIPTRLLKLHANPIYAYVGCGLNNDVILTTKIGDYSRNAFYLKNVKQALQVIQYVSHKADNCSYSIKI